MSAPNIATLYDWESHFEDVLVNYFTGMNVGGFQFAQVVTPRSNITEEEFQVTPRLAISTATLGPLAAGGGITESIGGGGPGTYFSGFQLQVLLTIATSRSNVEQPHGLLRGGTRQGMLEVTSLFNPTDLPYYQVLFANPPTSTQAVDTENDEIQTQLTYVLDVGIPPSSYPNS